MNERTTDAELAQALDAYAEQHRLAQALERDYALVRRSRFFALRTLWRSFKALVAGVPPDARELGAPPPVLASFDDPSIEISLERAWTAFAADAAQRGAAVVSIVIPVYNHLGVTQRCLLSLARSGCDGIPVEIIVVDDGSSDDTAEALHALDGLVVLGDGINRGFVGACNVGAARARGRFIYFLNNDTEVRDGWLRALVSRIESDGEIGAVGSKLIYPDGTLQEAGGIIWRDGTGWNYGRGDDPRDARYGYARNVDYCSGASLLVRADLFREIGGFSSAYAPAYYEDTDLCFALRARGQRVVYEPRSEVVHHEGVTSGTEVTSGTKRFQEINRPKFREKWAEALRAHAAGERTAVPAAARRLRTGAAILVIDSHVPLYDRDAGSLRMLHLLRIMRESGYHVMFLPDNYAALQPYTSELQALGIEVLYHTEGGRTMREAIDEVLPLLDAAWICRPELFAKYAADIARNPATKLIYDTIDLHFVRLRRQAEVEGRSDDTAWKQAEALELDAARTADATVVVTACERELLRARGIRNVHVISSVHPPEVDRIPAFEATSGILFIGGYNHHPNVDAALWLCREIMPTIWRDAPETVLHLLGSNPPESVRALANDRVRVPGYVHDVSGYFRESRVFVAPLRYGAGIKGKVGQALAYGLPCVLTDIAVEGFDLTDGVDCLIANGAASFARATLRLLREPHTRTAIAERALDAVAPFSPRAVGETMTAMLRDLLEGALSPR